MGPLSHQLVILYNCVCPVIDFCLTKNLECDAATNFTSLQVQWASQANMAQRKGEDSHMGGRMGGHMNGHMADHVGVFEEHEKLGNANQPVIAWKLEGKQ